jgi:hypothetical protein
MSFSVCTTFNECQSLLFCLYGQQAIKPYAEVNSREGLEEGITSEIREEFRIRTASYY